MNTVARYSKALIAAVGLAASVAVALNWHYAWVPAVIAAATALGVYQVPNKPAPARPSAPARTEMHP